jgi:hypothetical protein
MRSGAWDELTAGTPGDDAPVGVTYHPDGLCRTAGYVTRLSGGVGGGRPRGPSLSRLDIQDHVAGSIILVLNLGAWEVSAGIYPLLQLI